MVVIDVEFLTLKIMFLQVSTLTVEFFYVDKLEHLGFLKECWDLKAVSDTEKVKTMRVILS